MTVDYRLSHISPNKGVTYDASFEALPYRKMVWMWEKEILTNQITKIQLKHGNLRYLDFACGTGRILAHLEASMMESYGVDVSQPMLDIAEQRVKTSRLFRCDITKENMFPDDYFDLVTAFRFFLNAQKDLREDVLQVLHKIIKQDGYLIFNIHMNKGCLLERAIYVYQWIKNIDKQPFALAIDEVRDLLGETKFNIREMNHFGVIPIYAEDHRLFNNLINKIENSFSRTSILLPYSRYIIFVCQKK